MIIARYSGKPVSVEALQQCKAEFQQGYDKILEEFGQDMKVVHEKLEQLDAELAQKWPRTEDVPMPKNAKAWKKLVDQYQAPVLIARSMDNPKALVLIIMDELT